MIGDFYVIFVIFLVGNGEPLQYCDKIPTKSPFCMVVVLVSKVGIGSDPLGQNPNFGQKLVLQAPFMLVANVQ